MLNLCIDFGSTFIKYLIYDGASILSEGKAYFPGPCIDDGIRYEVPISHINDAILEILDLTSGYSAARCFIAVQMHGYVLRSNTGEFSNYISWKDQRADISAPLLQDINFDTNGTALKRNLPAAKLIPDLEPTITEFFTLGSYLAFFLTARNITHKTDACASGFFNAQTLVPIPSVEIMLPEVTHNVLPIGNYRGMEIYTPVGDHQLSFLGSDAGNEAYLLNIGTATQISTLSRDSHTSCNYERRPYFTQDRLLTVSGLTGGEKLFAGYDLSIFCKEMHAAIGKLPLKKKLLVGGGGSELVFQALQRYFQGYHIQCEKIQQNISTEGMIRLCNMCKAKIGTMLSEVCFPNFPVILKNENMDFLIIDNEHGAFDYSFLSAIVMNARLVGLSIIVRLSDNSRRDITKLVDMGVTGFLLPMTNCAADIQQVVDYAKYAPIGKRGISTNRAHTLYNPPPIHEYMESANHLVKVYAQIETQAGIDHLEEILSANGVDGVFIGPNDLSCDLNCIGNNEPIKQAIRKIAEDTHGLGKLWGIITTSADLIQCSQECDVDLISYGSEINMLKDSCRRIKKLFP